MRNGNYFLISILVFFGCSILSYFIEISYIDVFLSLIPTITGILLAGVLTSLALIFGLLSEQDLASIHKQTEKVKGRDIYIEFTENLKIDTIIIFFSFIGSIILYLLNHIQFYLCPFPKWLFLSVGLFMLFLSIFAIYGVIMSLFTLNQLRYKLATQETPE